MTGFAERTQITTAVQQREGISDWAPYRAASHEERHPGRARFSGFGVLAAFLIFSGMAGGVARGQAGLVESYGFSPESLLVAGWLIQGVAALLCFVLADRWLRS